MPLMNEQYPPYACKCCGVTNGDMLWDYIDSNKETLTYAEVVRLCDEFDTYRIEWQLHNDAASRAIRAPSKRKPYVKKSPYWENRGKS